MIRTTHARRRAVRPLAAAAAAATAGLFAALAGPAHAFHGLETARTAGDDRVETAAEIARQAHPDGSGPGAHRTGRRLPRRASETLVVTARLGIDVWGTDGYGTVTATSEAAPTGPSSASARRMPTRGDTSE
jgi:hypothetical protein